MYTVHWEIEALTIMKQIFDWYFVEMGSKAANKFRNGIIKAVNTLEVCPTIGKIEPLLVHRSKCYRSFAEYSNHKIIYFVENDIVHIVYIWDNRQSLSKMNILVK